MTDSISAYGLAAPASCSACGLTNPMLSNTMKENNVPVGLIAVAGGEATTRFSSGLSESTVTHCVNDKLYIVQV